MLNVSFNQLLCGSFRGKILGIGKFQQTLVQFRRHGDINFDF